MRTRGSTGRPAGLEVNAPVRLHNRYDIEVRDAKTGALKQRAQAENMILNGLWARLLVTTPSGYGTHIAYGTGTGTLAATRTALFSYLSYKAASAAVWDRGATFISRRISITMLENEHVGSTLTEVGLCAGSTTIYTHALLKDMNGNQVSILKTDEDIITIYATVYLVFPEGGWYNGSVILSHFSSSPIDFIMKLLGEAVYFGTGGLYYSRFSKGASVPGGLATALAHTMIYTLTLDVANKRITLYARLPSANGNSAYGIGEIGFGNQLIPAIRLLYGGSWRSADTVIGEQIGVGDGTTTDFATVFPRIAADATIKVDGVITPATIMAEMPNTDSIAPFMEIPPECDELACTANASYLTVSGLKSGYFRNPFYQTFGITGMYLRGYIFSSDDNSTWTQVAFANNVGALTAIPAGHQNKQYWKCSPDGSTFTLLDIRASSMANYKNVRFATAPAVGAVITADYTPKAIPKDINHVYDTTVVLQLGEYTP